jgi:hypothetical protein
MKVKELFSVNPENINLKNEGVCRLRSDNQSENDLSIAQNELKTFACVGEYHDGLRKIMEVYLQHFDEPKQHSFWVSGSWGSGKSHLVKMAGYLWTDFEFPDGTRARSIKPLPPEIEDLLFELDRKQKIYGKLSIAGTLRDFPSKDVRYSFIQLLLNTLGLPSQYHHFKFMYWAKKEGIYDGLKALVEAKGRNLDKEIGNLYVSYTLAKAILELKPELAENADKLLDQIGAQFPRVEIIGREDFVRIIKEEILPISFGSKIPCTIIALDDIHHFVGQDINLALDLMMLKEVLSCHFNGRFLLVVTAGNTLNENPILQKLKGKFERGIHLAVIDNQSVLRNTILQKKETAYAQINSILESSLGAISNNLENTIFEYLPEDRKTLVADYPILPSTIKFWDAVLQVTKLTGISDSLRYRLRIVGEGLKQIANTEVGTLVPADFIFTMSHPLYLQSGLLHIGTHKIIQEKKAKGGDYELEGRILSAIFLLDQVISNTIGTGLISDKITISDLLIDNLYLNSDTFRNKIKELIDNLVNEKVIIAVGNEYKLYT